SSAARAALAVRTTTSSGATRRAASAFSTRTGNDEPVLVHPGCAKPVRRPVRVGQAGDRHARSLVRCVDELAAADVDAVVRKAGHVRVLEEHDVTRLEVAPAWMCAGVVLAPHAARDG